MGEMSYQEQTDIHLEMKAWSEVNACCGRITEDCTCPIKITQTYAMTMAGEEAYALNSSCCECVFFCSFACTPYKAYLRSMAEGWTEWPSVIRGCDEFVWDPTYQYAKV